MIPPDSRTESLLPTAIRSGVGVGDVFLRFDLLFGVGDGVGEAFFRFAEAVGDGVGVAFFVECFRCLRLGVGLGSGSKSFFDFCA